MASPLASARSGRASTTPGATSPSCSSCLAGVTSRGARRYSPHGVIGTEVIRRIGRPDVDLVSTSYVERFNPNTRQNCRRFTRLTNAFSKTAQNHAHAAAVTFFAHNFVKPHGKLSKMAGH